jgi:hypothetical protein
MSKVVDDLLRATLEIEGELSKIEDIQEKRVLLLAWNKKWQETIREILSNIEKYPSILASKYLNLFEMSVHIDLVSEEKRIKALGKDKVGKV